MYLNVKPELRKIVRTTWNISITTFRGAKHYQLTYKARRLAVGSAIASIAIFFSSVGVNFIQKLDSAGQIQQIAHLTAQLDNQLVEQQRLVDERDELLESLENRSQRLVKLDHQLGLVEGMLGVDSNADENQRSLEVRLTNSTDSLFEKQLLLRSIPRGYPTVDKVITDRYGTRTHPVTGRSDFHPAVDLRAKMRSEIYAASDGIIEIAGRHSSGMGVMVEIRHNYGFNTVYGHLDSVSVEPGQFVRQGEVIGLSGKTGLTNAPHLHYEVHFMGKRLNPTQFLEWDLDGFDTLQTNLKDLPWDSLEKAIARNINQPNQESLVQQPLLQGRVQSTDTSP